MKEILDRIGVQGEMWIVSFFSATLFALYRVYETELMPSRRKVISTVIMGLISALLVPGLVVHIFNITNVFTAAAVTGVTVYSFEQVVSIARSIVLKQLKNKDDGNNA